MSCGGRVRDAEVNRRIAGSSDLVQRSALARFLTDSAYARRVLRYLMGLPTPLNTTDRQVLESTVFEHFASLPRIRSVLFVGCDWYTRHYGRAYFRSKNYWTIDPRASARKFGARRHVVAPLEELDRHFPANHFELIICNGVFGHGLDTRQQCEQAFDQCFRALCPGGQFVLGWDDIPRRTPVSLDELASLRRFIKQDLPAFGTWRYVTDTPYRHTYDFYCVPAR